MKYFLFSVFFYFFSSILLFAQLPEDGPLAESYLIHNGGGEELVSITGGYSGVTINISKYYKAFELYPYDTLISVLTWEGGSQVTFYDMDLYDFDSNDLQEIVAAWTTSDREVEIVLLKADPARLIVDSDNAWDKSERINKISPAVFNPAGFGFIPGVFIKAGNFDADSLGEFVIAYLAADGMVEITLYDVSDSLTITELASIRDQHVSVPPQINLCEDEVTLFDIECTDFNGDGKDEILLSGRMGYDPQGWQIFANVYSYNEDEEILEAKVSQPVFTQSDTHRDIGNFNTASGKFFSADSEQVVIGFFQYDPYQYGTGTGSDLIANILIPIAVNDQLDVMRVGETVFQRQDTIPNDCYYGRVSTLSAADVNNDGIDELLSAFSFEGSLPTFKIYQGDQPLILSVYADLDNVMEEFKGSVAFGNFYKDTLEENQPKELLIIGGGFWESIGNIYQIQTHPDGSFYNLHLKKTGLGLFNSHKSEPFLAGNLDGDIRLGIPRMFSVTNILQPLVILNAPPIHFDVFGGQNYDICRSYNENSSEFVARYVKETLQSTEVQTEVNKDWSTSNTLSAGGGFWGISVSAHLTHKYGKRFSEVEGSSRTVTVGFEIEATVDDQIYATIMDYDIWEYPVYGDNILQGHVLVVDPQVVRNSWFDSKSWNGYSYLPNHEVGNILSYRRYPLLSNNPLLFEKIKGDYGFDTSFLLSGNSSYDWYLNFQDFTESSATTTKEYSRDWGASVSIWGAGYSISGSYNSEDIQTQRTTVESGIYLDVHLDEVDMSIGETRYEVTPYAYWARNGALVIDYAVDPEIAAPGGEDTWWDTHYGYQPDPAFILPWRYDPEKGDAISDTKRYQTKDIQFTPQSAEEGDLVTIHSQVHNFSLLPTPGPMGVKFYVGDPDSGGILIEGVGGISEVFTDGIIPPRGTMEVELQWEIPFGIGAFPRIYAVVDAENGLPEIHENNNKAWNIFQKTTVTTVEPVGFIKIPAKFKLFQNYPNPFNPITTINYQTAMNDHITLSIYNVLGQEVATLVSQNQPAGEYSVKWDAAGYGSGIYFYNLAAGNGFSQTKKLLLLK